MGTEDNKDLFTISLTETGIQYIKNVARLIGIIFFISLLSIITVLILTIKEIELNSKYEGLTYWQSFKLKLFPWLTIIGAIGNIASLYFYMKFWKTMNQSLETNDQALFNTSFKYAHRNAIIFICVVVLLFLLDMFTIAVVLHWL